MPRPKARPQTHKRGFPTGQVPVQENDHSIEQRDVLTTHRREDIAEKYVASSKLCNSPVSLSAAAHGMISIM
jgi:hypothetical protein